MLNANDGKLHWKLKTGDLIKSSACIDFENGYAYFGSYDKHIYCVDIEVNFRLIKHFIFKNILYILKNLNL